MNEKQKKKLSKLLTRWGVGEEELKKFLADYDNEPDEEEPEGNENENSVDDGNENGNGNENVDVNQNDDNNDGNNDKEPEGNEADGNGVENPTDDGKDANPEGGVVDSGDEQPQNPENENNQTEENNELLTRVGELQDALNGLENRLASLEAGLSKAGVLVNDNPNVVGGGADNNAYGGEQPTSSREEYLAILNGRK